MPWRTVIDGVGRMLVVAGVVILLFLGYQLWGTGITEAHSQARLRAAFEHQLAVAGHDASTTTSPVPTTTSTPNTPDSTRPSPAPVVAAPADGSPVGVIEIPKIGLDQVVVEGTSTADLRLGPGHYSGTPLPGEAGNVAIAGHRTTYQHPFYNLNLLVPGDDIRITTLQGTFTYQVQRSVVVSPSDTAVADPTPTPTLTLTTCTPVYSASHRLVVQARLLSAPAPTIAPPVTSKGKGSQAAQAVTSLADDAAGGGDWVPALWWGLADAAVGLAVWLLARRTGGMARRGVTAVGVLAVLAVLFLFFQAVSPLVPAGF